MSNALHHYIVYMGSNFLKDILEIYLLSGLVLFDVGSYTHD